MCKIFRLIYQYVELTVSRAFLFSVPIILLQIYVTVFEREGLLLASGNVVGRDFVNYWVGGSNALKGLAENLFVFENYLVLLREAMGSGINNHNWSYPPHFLLLAVPFGECGSAFIGFL